MRRINNSNKAQKEKLEMARQYGINNGFSAAKVTITIIGVYIATNIIRILCGWGMFVAFGSGNYLLAAILFIGALKRDWLIYNPIGYGNRVQVGSGGVFRK